MRQLWREYGLIALLIAVSMGAYWYYSQHRDVLLTASLDAIGDRLVQMVDGDDGTVARLFERFKERVAARSVSADQVASLTASVLNLQQSGARLTPQDVELILTPAPEGGLLPAPEAPPANAPAAPLDEAGLDAVLAFEAMLDAALPPDTTLRQVVRKSIQYEAGDGLQVAVDGDLRAELPPAVWERLAPEL